MDLLGVGLDFMSVLITFVIMIGVILGKKNSMNEYFPTLLLMHSLALMADIGTFAFANDSSWLIWLKLSWILHCSFLMCEVAGFNLYVDKMICKKIGKKPMFRAVPFVIVAICIVLWITSLEHGLFFSISDEGIASYGRFFWIIELVGVVIAVFAMGRVMVNHLLGKIDRGFAIGIYLFVAIPILMIPVVNLFENLSFLLSAITISYMTMYISIHVRGEQELLVQEANKEKMQTELIMSQIQPHFIFNSLTTIKYLCNTNPHLAVEAITKFTKYLRRNLDTVGSDELVLFKSELEHTKTYLWIEQLRFGKSLNVEYSIDCDDFLIPPLSVQPIVENAVKHGITKKIGGGTVSISVRETDKCYRITVSDDGVGFSKQERANDKDAHIGIADVRKRLSHLNGSTLTVNSQVGVGTSVVYEIKKDE